MYQPLYLCRILHDYLNFRTTINYIVVDIPDDNLVQGTIVTRLEKENAVNNVRHALNVWHYSAE